jgi:diguanylate cyclase (GGDEF)-like protein
LDEWNDTTGVTVNYDGAKRGELRQDRPALVVLSGLHLGQLFLLPANRRVVIGRGSGADIRLVDEGVSRHHISITRGDDDALWLEDLQSRNGTYCNGVSADHYRLRNGDKIVLGRSIMLRFSYMDEFDIAFQRQMYESALRDGLTRAFNKRYFNERLTAEFHFAVRHDVPLSLLLLDLDHFKRVNDRYGHVTGDYVLARFAEQVQRNVRNEDVFARFGGEEFAIISRAIARDAAQRFAERLRGMVETLMIEHEGQRIPLTMSVGIAALPEAVLAEPIDLLRAVDNALYRAKSKGRNQVAVYDPKLDEAPNRRAGTGGHST